MPKLRIDANLSILMHPNAKGESHKKGVVLHETVSPQYPGMRDILGVANYLAHSDLDYAIHGITDDEGHIAWTLNCGEDVYWHCAGGNTNTNYLGIEQISRVMLDYKTRVAQIQAWSHMKKELNATAKLIACAARAWGFPIVDNRGDTSKPGITTHYEVSKFYAVQGGHTDGWPVKAGGYYPKGQIITLANRYYKLGWHF